MNIVKGMTTVLICLSLAISMAAVSVSAAPQQEIRPDSRCSVCGMFVAKYPKWISQIRLEDDSLYNFDGVKDMMRYYFNPEKYSSTTARNIKELWVKDYYTLAWIDAKKAFYVIGSDVMGPMGKEFVPFVTREEADGFLRDHHGKEILPFQEITLQSVQSLMTMGHKKQMMQMSH